MAVPAEIRAVPRPKNTVVEDSGRNGPKRYAVRERKTEKYIRGGNPQPRNGKVIGHIIDFKYVPSNRICFHMARLLSSGLLWRTLKMIF